MLTRPVPAPHATSESSASATQGLSGPFSADWALALALPLPVVCPVFVLSSDFRHKAQGGLTSPGAA